MQPHEKIIVALDVATLNEATRYAALLAPYVGYFKVGLELITAIGGPAAVAAVRSAGGKVMYDAKFSDIPNTMAGAARSVNALGAELFTVHASSGPRGMKAVADAKGNSLALAVTVLTSFDDGTCDDVFGRDKENAIMQFALTAAHAGMDGIVCAPPDLALLRPRKGVAWMQRDPTVNPYDDVAKLLKVTPGVRPAWAATNDQKRVATPGEAVRLGADFLVIGRPILAPPDGQCADAAKRIAEEIHVAMRDR